MRNIGIIFQFFNLVSKLTAVENVELSLALMGIGRREKEEDAGYEAEADTGR